MKRKTVTARKSYWCDADWAHNTRIDPGDKYVRCTEFPGDDPGYATYAGHPVVWRLCMHCGADSRVT